MRYVAAASPGFVAAHFSQGVNADSLRQAPSLEFSPKDELQQRWVQRLCGHSVDLPRHTLPSAQAYVSATLAGMGWAMLPQALASEPLARGQLLPIHPDSTLDVPLYWQHARMASKLLAALQHTVSRTARAHLLA